MTCLDSLISSEGDMLTINGIIGVLVVLAFMTAMTFEEM